MHKNATAQTEGARAVSRDLEFYNLDVIIAVGCRVKIASGQAVLPVGQLSGNSG